jgi:hypothetical protein
LVVRELAKHDPVQTMAHWSQSEARPKIREALAAVSRHGANENPSILWIAALNLSLLRIWVCFRMKPWRIIRHCTLI